MSPEFLFVRALLRWRARKGPIAKAVGTRGDVPHPTPRMGEVRVAAAQTSFHFMRSGEAFAREARGYVREAAAGGAELVVFPEDIGTMLLGILPRFERLEAMGSLDEALSTIGRNVGITDVVALAGGAALRVYLQVFSGLARAYSIYIQGGSIMVPSRDGRTFNVGYLFGPKGGLLSSQKKCHLLPLETEWGLAPGDDLDVVETPLGKIAHPICMDATYFETFEILSEKGAEIVCLPSADPDPRANRWKALRGLWPRVQESGVYGVQAAMVGGALGLQFSGQSAVVAPLQLTPQGDGFLAEARENEPDLILADLDMDALRRYRLDPPIRPNRAFEEAYFPEIYHGFWRGGLMRDS